MARSAARRHLHCGSPDLEDVLVAELKRHTLDVKPQGLGLVMAGVVVDAVFARQVLVDARLVTAKTPADLPQALLELDDGISLDAARIDVSAPDVSRVGSKTKELHPLAEAAARLTDTLQKKTAGRRAQGKLGPSTPHRMRALLVTPSQAWVSVVVNADDRLTERGGTVDALTAWPSPFPLGRAVSETAKDAPSSAHRKLDEAFAWLGASPGAGDVVVDLGAAPGGWTRVLRDRGARVVAVDRADLDPALLRDPLVTHLKKDALAIDLAAHQPSFVVCDVIWEPAHSLTIVERALKVPGLRGLVVTLKLRRPVDLDVLDRAVDLATQSAGFAGRVKHLVANKLEVTLLMRGRG